MPLDTTPSPFKQQDGSQHTLNGRIACRGVGLHSGELVTMTLAPAPVNHGITFIRTDITGKNNIVPARFDSVSETTLCTVISNAEGVSVSTIEHIMAALAGCAIDNAIIELDGPEAPIMDGSAEPFVFLIDCVGIQQQAAPRAIIEILRPVTVEKNGMSASLTPSAYAGFEFEIEFNSPVVRRQRYNTLLAPSFFRRDIARARTFGFLSEVDKLRQMGLARGGSLENAIVIDDKGVLNNGGLRYGDEFVRHKVLDAIGDLALAGAPIKGQFKAFRSGHALNNQLLHALFADERNYRIISESQDAPTRMVA